MKRTSPNNIKIPDAINCTASSNFTQIPNDMLRNPKLSAKAKGILCLLLSNREGWSSCIATIMNMMSDGETTIRSGLAELEKVGYLVRLRYREKKSKVCRGMIWCYTDYPHEFDLEFTKEMLDKYDLEIYQNSNETKPTSWKSTCGFSTCGKTTTNNTNSNNTNNKKNNNRNFENQPIEKLLNIPPIKERLITPSMFEKFWKLYPRKVDQGRAKTKWEQICSKKDRPTWKEIKKAILAQRKSERWQQTEFIPHPTTWLNQQRWLDDPAEMKSYDMPFKKSPVSASGIRPEEIIKKRLGSLASAFTENCYTPAKQIITDEDEGKLARKLLSLYEHIQAIQSNIPPGLLPSPISIIQNYLEWIEDNDWISDRTVKLLSVSHTLFKRFRREEARKDNMERDPVTGKSYLG